MEESVKTRKKKLALPRRKWKISPVTRVKGSDKKYSRSRAKQERLPYAE
jgi:hypothetical protein